MVSLIGHSLVSLVLGGLLLASYRWIRRQSAALGIIVGIAIVTRLAIGLAMFWVSYLALPFARSLQVGGGFWQVALDATGYYQMSAHAAEIGTLYPLDHAIPSPVFVNTLALWMMAVGISPAAGMFLNLCIYLLITVMVMRAFAPVNEWRRDLPCIVGIGAYSFSPVILLHSTQPLKDELSALFVALACLSVLALQPLTHITTRTRLFQAVAIGAVGAMIATFGMAGIRWYYALIIWAALAVALMAFVVRGRSTPLPVYLTGSVCVLLAAWLGFWGGAGPFYRQVGANLSQLGVALEMPSDQSAPGIGGKARAAASRLLAIPSDLAKMTQLHRTGFLMAGGRSNVVVPLRNDSATGMAYQSELTAEYKAGAAYQERLAAQSTLASEAAATLEGTISAAGTGTLPAAPGTRPPASGTRGSVQLPLTPEVLAIMEAQAYAARSIPVTITDHVKIAAAGQALLFVPLSLLKAGFGISIPQGGGILSLADFDTVFLDTTIIFVLAMLWKRRRTIGNRLQFAMFSLIFSGVTAILLGYVVTNFGTLWRMRPLVAVPIWVVVVALGHRPGTSHISKAP